MNDPRADADTIRDLGWQLYRAMRDGDASALEVLFADEMFYLHSNAASDSKSALLAKIRDRELRCPDVLHHPDDDVIVDGDTAVATGQVTGTVHAGGTAITLHNRSLAVWRRRGGGWRLLAYQSTPIPAGQLWPGRDDGNGRKTT